MDQILGGLFGGNDDDDEPTRRNRANDFVQRYQQGAPEDDIDGMEAMQNYRQVSDNLSPDEYEDAAREAFGRMQPNQRQQFGQMLQQQMGGQGGQGGPVEDPRELAGLTRQFRQQQPGGLASLFGGGGGNSRGGNDGGGIGDMLQNPIARAALGGVAAIAMQKMFNKR